MLTSTSEITHFLRDLANKLDQNSPDLTESQLENIGEFYRGFQYAERCSAEDEKDLIKFLALGWYVCMLNDRLSTRESETPDLARETSMDPVD